MKSGKSGDIAAWIREAQAGKVEAFGRVVARYERFVYSVAFSYTLNEEDALDLTQSVFLKAFASLRQLEDASSFTTWLIRIAHNVCTDWARRKGRHPMESSIDDGSPPVAAGASAEAVRKHAAFSALLGLLAEMPSVYRTAFVLHYLEHLPYNEIADMLGVPFSTIVGRIHKAREFLRARQQEMGLEE